MEWSHFLHGGFKIMRSKQFCVLSLVLGFCALAVVEGRPSVAAQSGERVTFTMRFNVNATAGIASNTLTFAVPADLPQRQKVISLTFSQPPTQLITSDGGRYARFVMNNPPASTVITATAIVELSHFDLTTAEAFASPALESAADLQPWLANEKYLERDAP